MRFGVIMMICSVVLLALLFYVSMKNPAKNRLTKIIRFLLAVILLIVFFVYGMKEFGPRGNNPIFSKAGRGENEGEDTQQTSKGQELSVSGREILEIVIDGFSVNLAGENYDCSDNEFDTLDERLTTYATGGYSFRIVADYGVASVYHHVNELLNGLGAKVETVEIN